MTAFVQRLKKLFARSPEPSMEELREAYRRKYHNFRLLLAANNAALTVMTEMETALFGNFGFGMTFVRSQCTAVCVNVYSLIKYLNELGGNKYQVLETIFKGIQDNIESYLTQYRPLSLEALVLPLEEVNKEMGEGVGGKMANLGEIAGKLPDLAVPEGFVITAAAYEAFMRHNDLQAEINRLLTSLETDDMADLYRLSSEIQMRIIGSEVPPAVAQAIDDTYRALQARVGPDLRVSLRSSATGEDTLHTSFAGQYRSELNVSQQSLLAVYKEIVASKYALTAITYRLHKGIRDEDVAMCVGCMRMVHAAAGGVMYSRDPTDSRNAAIVINAVHGLAQGVVDGSLTPDLWMVSRTTPLTITHREIADKQARIVSLPEEGVVREVIDEAGRTPALNDDQVLELARLALRLEEHFQQPQDIEWSIDSQGRIYILQSRPLQQTEVATEMPLVTIGADHPVLLTGGDTASPGAACGPAYHVKSNVDMLQFPEGAVLITALPHPGWAPLLSRAVAVVTDRGGITGHLANVAREFAIPALFNTGTAADTITPGSLITVDATSRVIYEGRVEALLAEAGARTGFMVDTPVYETLKGVMQFITPLNLTDPDNPDFRAANCRTLHDITRYAHEKSVHEMFDYDKTKKLARYFIKQLVVDVPMQWWVLDLEDGFKKEVPGREVRLDNIASLPMLALWEGIHSVRWEGPPPVDAKGFLSILSQAAANPNLETAGPSAFANQNYFMISKYFCNLTSRFGFHFSTVEALVGPQDHENFMRFAFKGGAADFPRRLARARLIAEIMERYHFKVDIKGDSLFARLEGEPADYMLSRLKILGYLSVHTRQLDMVMLNEDQTSHYYHKIIRDIDTAVLGGPAPETSPEA